MPLLYILPLVTQALAPVGLLAWLWFAPGRSRALWLARLFTTAAYLVTIALAGLWLMVPWFLAILYFAILVFIAHRNARLIHAVLRWPQRRVDRVALALTGLTAVAFAGLAGSAICARWPPAAQMIELEFPLHGRTYLVANGGSTDLVNAHVQTLTAPQFRDYRGQSYGVDIVKVNALGLRSNGVLPADPRRYEIFGEPIHAPCSGEVLRAEDGLPDMPPPQPDRGHLPGNFVFMECDGVHVLLGHMERGTVHVRAGERVQAGAVLGQVGNSGNSNEPHLHIHAQRPANGAAFLSGDPLPVRLNGRFLVRNDRVQAP
jgi:hypothetical protein